MEKIPKIIHQTWVGEKPRPEQLMKTWREKHPDWEFMFWDEISIFSRPWKNQKHIDQYYKEKQWPGVADLVRYEAQFDYGGIIAPADSECLLPLDELLDEVAEHQCDCFTCPESDYLPEYVVPILGATKGNELLKTIIDSLHQLDSVEGTKPWKTTGNKFVGQVIKGYPRIRMFPYYYFVPEHYRGWKYRGNDKIYTKQNWGTTKGIYDKFV